MKLRQHRKRVQAHGTTRVRFVPIGFYRNRPALAERIFSGEGIGKVEGFRFCVASKLGAEVTL